MWEIKSIQTKQWVTTGINIFLVAALLMCGAVYFISDYSLRVNRELAAQGVDGLNLMLESTQQRMQTAAGLAAVHPGLAAAMTANDPAAAAALVKALRETGKTEVLRLVNAQGQTLVGEGGNEGQTLIKQALQGTVGTAVENDADRLLVAVAVPVKSPGGQILGTVIAATVVSRDEVVDAIKKHIGVDCTFFAGDKRVATTIVQDGKRVVGTKLDPVLADRVLNKKETFSGEANILGVPYVTYYQPLLGPDQKPIGVLFAGKSQVEARAVRNAILSSMGGGGLVVLLISIAFAIWSARKLTKPLKELEGLMNTAGTGDLRIKAPVHSADEMGRLAHSFNLMIDNQGDVVGGVIRGSRELSEASEELAASSQEMSATVTEMSRNVAQVAHKAATGEESLVEVSKVLIQLSSLIQLAKDRAVSAGEGTALTRQAAGEGQSTVTETVRCMAQMQIKIKETEDLISRLNEYSSQIGVITETITSIAGQTNLLALNAAIEAARAGEAGRGFAVVAEEVRKLAEQSDQGAREVSQLLGKVTENTTSAVDAARQSRLEMEKAVGSTDAAHVALSKILGAVEQMVDDVGQIVDVTNDEVATSDRILLLIDELGRGIEETARIAKEVAAATDQTAGVVEGVAASAEQTTSMAAEMESMVSRFKLRFNPFKHREPEQ
ncbi:MAG TPA: methyl-accepting chemotaxis protein [Patescibacteria group bacterium]|nr:methyl-accepting chemotaxis protein [Patescibacteria group bacterium]